MPAQAASPTEYVFTERDFQEVELESCRRDTAFFIENYVYIEDPDSAEILIPFTLWPGQKKALTEIEDNRLSLLLKARQLGVTWEVIAFAVHEMLFKPGYTITALSRSELEAKEIVRRMTVILSMLPSWMITEKKPTSKKKPTKANITGWTWEATALTVTIRRPERLPGEKPSFRKGPASELQAMPSGPNAGRSFTRALLIFDEWAFQEMAEKIFAAAYPSINRPTGGKVIGLSTNERGSLFEFMVKGAMAGENDFHLIFLPWWTDPRRTAEWYESTKRTMPITYRQEYPSSPEEAMSAGESTAFPEFSRMIHVCQPFKIPYWWKRWRGNDPGYADPFAWYWLAVSEEGIVYIYREYVRNLKDERVTYTDQAKQTIKLSIMGTEAGGEPATDGAGVPAPESFSFTVVGRDAWNKQGRAFASTPSAKNPPTGKSIIDCYTEGGLSGCIEPPTDQRTARIIRKAVFHEYLKPFHDERAGKTISKVQIFSTCTKLIEALPNLVVDPKDAEKVAEEPHVYTNPFDGAGYALVAYHVKHSKVPKEEKSDIQKDKDKLVRRMRLGRWNGKHPIVRGH